MTLTTEVPRKRTLHEFMIADWRNQPDCYICGWGAAYFQCRVCDKGVHEECIEKTTIIVIHPDDGGHCVQAGCDLKAFVQINLPNDMQERQCEGHWYRYQANACPPPEGTCKCGYSLAAPGVGYVSNSGWLCKRCGDLHTKVVEVSNA